MNVVALAVVKLPVLAVVAPTEVPSTLPPLIQALPELKFVATNVVTFPFVVLPVVALTVAIVA